MANNATKTPLIYTLDTHAQRKALTAIGRTGKALPCTVESAQGSIVTVSFDVTSGFTLPNMTIPVGSSKYIRLPLQKGDQGVAFPADASIGAITGLGPTTSNLAQPGNLAALTFFPVGNENFTPVDGNYLVLEGPDGVVVKDIDNNVIFTLSATGITINMSSSSSITIGNVTITNSDVMVSGVSLLNHVHSGVTTGSGDTGPPLP